MPVSRRRFLRTSALTAAAAPLLAGDALAHPGHPAKPDYGDWEAVRREFALAPEWVHLGLFFLVSHPRPVREAVEAWRRELDANPVLAVEHAMFEPEFGKVPNAVKGEIASYIGGAGPDEIAFAGSTTEGLTAVYQGLRLAKGDEILTTAHDHFVHHEAIRMAADRAGATWRAIPLFDSTASIDAGEIVARIANAIRPATRAIGVTWVHSSTGLRIPLAEIGKAVAAVNAKRSPAERALLIVDGVHGLGIEHPDVANSGADFFCAGTHKWLFAPRGTGFVWGRPEAWARLRQTAPSFEAVEPLAGWFTGRPPEGPPRAAWFSPGGFHAFEHLWSIPAAIEFHRAIGSDRVRDRIRELNGAIKEGLASMKHVTLHTPRSPELSAGIVSFDVDGMRAGEVVERLLEKKVIATTSPYRVSNARLAAGVMNTHDDVEQALRAVRALA